MISNPEIREPIIGTERRWVVSARRRKRLTAVFAAILDSSMISGPVPIVIDALGVVALVAILIRRPSGGGMLRFGAAALVGVALGFVLAWYIGDVRNAFDVSLTFATRAWFAGGVALIAIGVTSLWRARGWRIPLGIASVVLFALAAAIGINSTIGEFPTVADALGLDAPHALRISTDHDTATSSPDPTQPLWQTWRAPTNMPGTGTVGTVVIPSTVSHFVARSAVVYLPPAALVAHAPKLPVMIFLGGQPGSPQTVLTSGQLPELLNAYAAAHDGLAPIVVVPDQLGASAANPMCLDSALGHVATYITVDVPNWIRTHLNVQTARTSWAIGGFSEGGTCSIQLGTTHHSLFGSILDISGQVAPLNGSVAHTIKVGFGGSTAAYRAGTAPALLAASAPFSGTLGVFVVGQDDSRYGPQTAEVEKAARAARMDVHAFVSPGTAHDWYTEQYGLKVGVPLFAALAGLQR
jgi:S-formylglutathione hydrolase FrmB